MVCSQCGAYLPEGFKFCGQCGSPATATKKKCPKCRDEYDRTMVFCHTCGTLLEPHGMEGDTRTGVFTANRISLFEDGYSGLLPKKTGELSFFNEEITFTPVKGKTPVEAEQIRLRYADISACETTRHYGIPGITVRTKSGNTYSFIGPFLQPGFGAERIKKMIMLHIQ